MFDKVLKIWKDPVWSKVIATVLIATGIYIWSLIKDVSFLDLTNQLFNFPIKVGYVLIGIVIWRILVYIKNSNKRLTRKQKAMLEFNYLVYTNQGITSRWDIVFKGDKPYPMNIKSYCTLHKVPLKLYGGQCTNGDCKNSEYGVFFDSYIIKNDVESYIIHEWDRLNGRNLNTSV